MRRSTIPFVLCVAIFGAIGGGEGLNGQDRQSPPGGGAGPSVRTATRHGTTAALRDLPPIPPKARRTPHPPFPVRSGPAREPQQPDSALQTAAPTTLAISTVVNFEGVSNVDGVLPPDTNGDVGPNHYVQWVNLSLAIYSKTGSLLLGPVDGSTLWQGFGGPCGTNNDGDPIVLYDEQADRWLLSQFALPNFPSGPFYQCVAVSQSGDPLGSWFLYEFTISNTKLNDYPKFGVWPDGYYMAINQFTCSGVIFVSCSWAGQGVVAFDRIQMLKGQAAQAIYFDNPDSSLGAMLPSDLDGTLPPAGSPNYFVQVDQNALQIWAFRANWASPASSTFQRVTTLATAAFDANMCGGSRNCIPQPGTTVKVDAMADRLMYRLQYRNFGTYETLVSNHTVDTGGDHGGVRWYELRKTGGAWGVQQQGTFAPDSHHRWMGSAAMDGAGNLAIGYSISSTTLLPSIRFTGRSANDAPGQMTWAESDVFQGSGAQTHSSGRWGDYSMLAVDPAQPCRFWYTTQYYSSVASAAWRTRVGAFDAPSCGAGDPTAPAAPSNLQATATSASQINLTWTDNASNEDTFNVERCTGAGCTNFAALTTLGPNVTSFANTGLSSNTAYRYRVYASNAVGPSGFSNEAGAMTLAQPPVASLHVEDLTGSSQKVGGPNWQATVTVFVTSNTGAPVSGAAVTGNWSNGFAGSASCTTASNGRCSVTTGNIHNRNSSVTFTVTNVTGSLAYDSSANKKTSIVVVKP